MAITTPRRRRNPEGQMPLREHLAELRSRVVRSTLAIVSKERRYAVVFVIAAVPLFLAGIWPLHP